MWPIPPHLLHLMSSSLPPPDLDLCLCFCCPPARGGQQKQRQRSKSGGGRDDDIKCRRCGGIGHIADKCEMYPYWRGAPCDCGLLHKRRDCNSSPGSFITEVAREDGRQDGHNDAPHLYLPC